MLGADPFKRFSKFDFDFGRDIQIDARGMDTTLVKGPQLRQEISEDVPGSRESDQ